MAVVERERVPTTPERGDLRRLGRPPRAPTAPRRRLRPLSWPASGWSGSGVGMLGFGSLPGVSVVKEQIDGIAGGSRLRGLAAR